MKHNSEVIVNLNYLAQNAQVIKNENLNSIFCAVIKSNAYGHGLIQIAKKLASSGINNFAVATISEAIELRNAGVNSPKILLLAYEFLPFLDEISHYDITPVVYSLNCLKSLIDIAKQPIKIHLEVDTGMGRTGIHPSELKEINTLVITNKYILLEGVFTHFSCADSIDKAYTINQSTLFQSVIDGNEPALSRVKYIHSQNSAAVLNLTQSRCNMKRVGIMMYGIQPVLNIINFDLKPILSWVTKRVQIKESPIGSSISYGATWIATRNSLIVTIPVGYADGYSRLASNKGYALVEGIKAPIVGIICMDFMMLDVTDCINVNTDSEVVLIGNQGVNIITAEEMAEWSMSIPYEILCNVGKRSVIKYIESEL